MGTLLHDLRFGVRMLGKAPVVSLVSALSLALGIAATAATLSIADSFFRESFPYADADRLALVWEENPGRDVLQAPVSPANYLDLRDAQRSFVSLSAYTTAAVNLTAGDAEPEQVQAVTATPDLLETLGVQPFLGRGFRPAEGREGANREVILLHDFWARRFLADRSVLGREIELDGERYLVVGVMGPEFEMVPANVHLLRPSDFEALRDVRAERMLLVLGRLGEGVTLERASDEVAALHERLVDLHPEANREWRARAELLGDFFPGPTDTRLVMILIAVSLFGLLIACANVANLLLARAEERQKEVAVRTALGAGRGRILRQLLTESVVLAAVAGVLGVLASVWIVSGLGSAMPPELPRAFYPRLTAEVILAVAGLVLGAGVLFGLAPALQAAGGDLRAALGESRGGTASRGRRRVRNALVVGEFAVALALLTGSALLLRAFDELAGGDPGFDPNGVLTFTLSLPDGAYPSDDEVARFWTDLEARLADLPEVEAVAIMSTLPRSRNNPVTAFEVASEPVVEEVDRPRSDYQAVSPGYLNALALDLVAGRFLMASDRADGAPALVVNQAFARRYLPGREPLGQYVTLDAGAAVPREIVGVVSDIAQDRLSASSAPPPVLYVPLGQMPRRAASVAVKSRSSEPATAAPAVREAVWSIDRNLPVGQLRPLDEHVAEMLAGPRVIGVFLAAIGGIALLLAALGIYGVMAHSVVQRTREIGIRMALGAERGRVVRMVARNGLALAGAGLLAGLPLSWVMFRAVAGALVGLGAVFSPWGPFVGVAAILGGVSTLACLLPSVRAAAIEPVRALQGE